MASDQLGIRLDTGKTQWQADVESLSYRGKRLDLSAHDSVVGLTTAVSTERFQQALEKLSAGNRTSPFMDVEVIFHDDASITIQRVDQSGQVVAHERIERDEDKTLEETASSVHRYALTQLAPEEREKILNVAVEEEFHNQYKARALAKVPTENRNGTNPTPKEGTIPTNNGVSYVNNTCYLGSFSQLSRNVRSIASSLRDHADYQTGANREVAHAVLTAKDGTEVFKKLGNHRMLPRDAHLGEQQDPQEFYQKILDTDAFQFEMAEADVYDLEPQEGEDEGALQLDFVSSAADSALVEANARITKTPGNNIMFTCSGQSFKEGLHDFFRSEGDGRSTPVLGKPRTLTETKRSFTTPPSKLWMHAIRTTREGSSTTAFKGSLQDVQFELDLNEYGAISEEDHKLFLKGFLIHKGTADSGHYTCYYLQDGHWYYADGKTVIEVNDEDVLHAAQFASDFYYDNNLEGSDPTKTTEEERDLEKIRDLEAVERIVKLQEGSKEEEEAFVQERIEKANAFKLRYFRKDESSVSISEIHRAISYLHFISLQRSGELDIEYIKEFAELVKLLPEDLQNYIFRQVYTCCGNYVSFASAVKQGRRILYETPETLKNAKTKSLQNLRNNVTLALREHEAKLKESMLVPALTSTSKKAHKESSDETYALEYPSFYLGEGLLKVFGKEHTFQEVIEKFPDKQRKDSEPARDASWSEILFPDDEEVIHAVRSNPQALREVQDFVRNKILSYFQLDYSILFTLQQGEEYSYHLEDGVSDPSKHLHWLRENPEQNIRHLKNIHVFLEKVGLDEDADCLMQIVKDIQGDAKVQADDKLKELFFHSFGLTRKSFLSMIPLLAALFSVASSPTTE